MALAEPALRQFGVQRLQNVRIRGGSLLGTAIGSAIGIGYGLAKDYDLTFPWSPMLQPFRRQAVIGTTPSNGGANQQYQALHSSYSRRYRKRRNKQHGVRKCCCCTC